jgi:hypothetical protein
MFLLTLQMKIPLIMKSNCKIKIFSLFTLGLCAGFFSCKQQDKNAVQTDITKADSIKVFLLKTDSVKKTISLPGDLISLEKVQIRAKLTGYIKKLNVGYWFEG